VELAFGWAGRPGRARIGRGMARNERLFISSRKGRKGRGGGRALLF